MKEVYAGSTESGDRYSGTKERWDEYRKAWDDNDMKKVMFMEEGNYDDFYYDPIE